MFAVPVIKKPPIEIRSKLVTLTAPLLAQRKAIEAEKTTKNDNLSFISWA